jgi:atypical dual specificity phosphatase
MGLELPGPEGPTPAPHPLPAVLAGQVYRLDGDHLLVGGHLGTRQSPVVTRLRLEGLRRAGVDHAIALTEPEQEFRHGLEPEAYAAELGRRGITLSRSPIPDLSVPSSRQMTAILDEIDARLAAGQRVYVHCSAGLGRAGLVACCWLIRHRLAAPDQAVARLAELRSSIPNAGDSPQTPRQVDFVEAWRPGR